MLHVGIITLPGRGRAIIGMRHVPQYRDELAGYEILTRSTGAACDVCGLPVAECAA